MRLAIIGGTSYIGNNFIKKLLANKNFKITCLIRNEKKAKEMFGEANIKYVVGDVLDKNSLNKAIKNSNFVFNFAAIQDYHKATKKDYWDVNVLGVKNILQVCLNNKARLIHISTVGVLGPTGKIPANENSLYNPINTYDITKCEGEKEVLNFYKMYKLPLVILRPTIVYGPEDTHSAIFKLICAIRKKKFFFVGRGDAYLHTLYIDNLLEGLFKVMKTTFNGEVYVLGDENPLTLQKLASIIAKESKINLPKIHIPKKVAELAAIGFENLGLDEILSKQKIRFLTEGLVFDISKAKKELNFSPQINIKEGLIKTIAWCSENGY